MKNKIIQLAIFVALAQLFWYCANVGVPTGGEKDETPPVVLKSIPKANALNYQDKTIYIEFDELIQLKDYRSKFIVSPPVNKDPLVEARGNKLMIEFEEDLQPNTTYTLDFADAIVDNNEGNVLENYSFSFSTGEYIDSLQVSGNLYDADDLSPSEGVLIYLHTNLNDTAIQTLVPIRMAKTNSLGRFNIRNVSPGKYRVYALEDANRNNKFDQPGEAMAWSDIIVEPGFEYREFTDTIRIDSLETDSVHYYEKLVYTPDSLMLFKFQHDYKEQYLTSEERKERAKLTYYFNRPLEEDAVIELTGNEEVKDAFIMDRSVANDTVTFWIADSTYYNQDSLAISLSYTMRDSLKNPYLRKDTIAMYFFEVKEKKKKRKKDDEPEPVPTIKLKDVKSTIDVFGQFRFSLPAPATRFNTDAIKLYNHKDTIPEEEVNFEIVHNEQQILNYTLKNEWEAGVKYEMIIDSAAIADIYGLLNDSINAQFSVKSLESYGKIFIQILNPHENWLVQILNRKEVVVQQTYITNKEGKIGFRYLNPGEYMLRIVVDENMNGQWDSGNYYERTQPEELIYYPKRLKVRKNWEFDEDEWDPTQFKVDSFSKQFRKPKKKEE